MPVSAAPLPRSTGCLRLWLKFFALFLGCTTCWGLATPLLSGPDEWSHVIKAAAVARGEWVGVVADPEGPATIVVLPQIFSNALAATTCYAGKPEQSAACSPEFEGDEKPLVSTGTTAGRYFPGYYAVVGWPSALSPTRGGVYAMRLVSAALCSAFLAWAVAAAAGWHRGRLLTAGTFVAATPMVLFLAGTVNPSGPEMACAISLWVAALILALDEDGIGRRDLWIQVALSGTVLTLLRSLSPLWVALTLLAVFMLAAPERRRQLLRQRYMYASVGLIGLGALVQSAWTLAMGALKVLPSTAAEGLSGAGIVLVSIGKTGFNLKQMVGLFGSLDAPAPLLVYLIWVVLVGGLVALALARANGRQKATLLTVAALSLGLPVSLEASQAQVVGFAWQGRYGFPFAVGVVLLAAAYAGLGKDQLSVQGAAWRKVAQAAVWSVAGAQVLSLYWTLRRYDSGVYGDLNPFDAAYRTPLPLPITFIAFTGLAFVLGLGGAAVVGRGPGARAHPQV